MRVNSFQLIIYCGTRPDSYRDDPAAETKSIGLPADPDEAALVRAGARWCLVFCSPSGLFHHDPKLTPITRTWYRQDNLS